MHKTELFNNVIARLIIHHVIARLIIHHVNARLIIHHVIARLIIHHVIARLCKSRGNLPASASTTSSVRHASLAKM